jgi:hypothetical protein
MAIEHGNLILGHALHKTGDKNSDQDLIFDRLLILSFVLLGSNI